MYIYRLARYHQSLERKHNKIEDAIKDALGDHSSGEAYPKDIIDEEGNIIIDHDALLKKFSEMNLD
jgi:hypothetical protein